MKNTSHKKPKIAPILDFEGFRVRRHFDEKKQKWFFSVIDLVAVLTQQRDFQLARNYWKVLKNRLSHEGSEVVTNCNQLKMIADDGKLRETDVADVETILRLVQSIPSPKAEPIKLWLARVELESKTGKKVINAENFLPRKKNVLKISKK